ncbi:phosphatidylglycerol lysyltransferase domain-containing protein [Kitasatospora sp. NBC_01287]|uniref:phosphatidylglycerol lysyltransferase domain-containing protein n=1 Tax=Kitasatospora sp. NBC_01287 TaxID=2903573 RepID=UPI002257496E|nr:phosphatidylglycerol lysyltransferase domain-containing protein [Kitasatospora sp. NBC_01287]MCX4747711.1 phosphatidylglycerol lysyltransferase domain-containing protein [Kitasatospora sp. NBC_01287]
MRRSGVLARLRPYAAAGTVWYLRLIALVNLVAVVLTPFRDTVRHHSEGQYFTTYLMTAGLASAVLSIFLAVAMRRRKRAAWIFNFVLGGFFFLLYVLALSIPGTDHYSEHPFNYVSTVLTGLFMLCLVVGRKEFTSKGDRSNPLTAVATFVGGLVLGGVVGAVLVGFFNRLSGADFGDEFGYAVARMVTVTPSDRVLDMIDVPNWLNAFINAMGAVLFLLVLYVAFRSPRGKELLNPADEEKLRALLEKQGERDSLGYFALRRDKAVIFSPTGKAAVTYRVIGGVSLASGDPIGDPEAWPGAIDAWLAEAREHAWAPAVMGASEEAGVIYARHGLDALELGDEAIVELDEFSLDGRAMRVVRQAYNRVKRAGYTVRVRRHEDIPEAEMAELLDKADRWRDGQTERGFSMALGRLGDPADGRCVMLECYDGQGEPRALLSFVPWGPNGLSLDLMRRDRETENGLIEFMVIELLEKGAGELDLKRVSLNFAMFRSVFERGSRLGAGPVLRLWRAVLGFFSRWWQIESLYRANAKYRPIWEPRYLLFEKSSEIPRIGIASARAEGFITAPSLPSLFRRRHTRSAATGAGPALPTAEGDGKG